jgi:hypothetical protein
MLHAHIKEVDNFKGCGSQQKWGLEKEAIEQRCIN